MARKKPTHLRREDADKYFLYQWSVQEPDNEVELLEKEFRRRRGKVPLLLREDFCSTAFFASHWVKSHPRRRAIGLDLDPEPLRWARRHTFPLLGDDVSRLQLLRRDVRSVTRPPVEVVCALNFSYYLFNRMDELTSYFIQVRQSLVRGGLFLLDCYGGWESQKIKVEPRVVFTPRGRFTYIWEQAAYNPIDNMTLCHIHFRFGEGKQMERAFSYHWRLYTPAEVRDALQWAGFRDIRVFWDFEESLKKPSRYRAAKRARNQPGWIAYVMAEK